MKFRLTVVNLAQRTNWDARFTKLKTLIEEEFRSSVYVFSECDYFMAEQIAKFLGWGSIGSPCWVTDRNRNTVLWDPEKFRYLISELYSLSAKPLDLAERHYRSVCWNFLEHRETKVSVWVGSSHLSNGTDAGPDREAQARVLAANRPDGPCVLGIDRNSRGTSSPAKILADAGLEDLTIGASKLRSYPAGDNRTDAVQIDAIHGDEETITLSDIRLIETFDATDHRAWRTTVEVKLSTT